MCTIVCRVLLSPVLVLLACEFSILFHIAFFEFFSHDFSSCMPSTFEPFTMCFWHWNHCVRFFLTYIMLMLCTGNVLSNCLNNNDSEWVCLILLKVALSLHIGRCYKFCVHVLFIDEFINYARHSGFRNYDWFHLLPQFNLNVDSEKWCTHFVKWF